MGEGSPACGCQKTHRAATARCLADEAQFLMMPGQPGGRGTAQEAVHAEYHAKSLQLTNLKNHSWCSLAAPGL